MKVPENFKLCRGPGFGPSFGPSFGPGFGQDHASVNLCFMETVSVISGDKVSAHPKCADHLITSWAIKMNDEVTDEERDQMMMLVLATAGTRSDEHDEVRRRIFSLAACELLETMLPDTEEPFRTDVIREVRNYAANPEIGTQKIEKVQFYAFEKFQKLQNDWLPLTKNNRCILRAVYNVWDHPSIALTEVLYSCSSRSSPEIFSIAFNALKEAIYAGPNGAFTEAEAENRLKTWVDIKSNMISAQTSIY